MSKMFLAFCLSDVAATLSAASGSDMTCSPQPAGIPGHEEFHEDTICQPFRVESATGSGWLLEDCIDVWRSWASSLNEAAALEKEDRQLFFDVSDRLKEQGTPCYVRPPNCKDGAGSRSMRSISSLVYAEDMGCDLLFPEGYHAGPERDGDLYCHTSGHGKGYDDRCAAVDWIEFFNWAAHMMPLPNEGEATKNIDVVIRRTNTVNGSSSRALLPHDTRKERAKDRCRPGEQAATEDFLKDGGHDRLPWVLTTWAPASSLYFIRLDTWNEAKFHRVRTILKKLREGLGQKEHPRVVGELQASCSFTTSTINIAIHVRLGDRAGRHGSNGTDAAAAHEEYIDRLEEFIETVSAAAVRQGGASPVFHIFSETSEPCPSTETRAFDEFLRWPVETNQSESCSAAVTPAKYWEKAPRMPTCNSDRSGVFLVQGKPLYLHVGLDVENAMSCMIEADGLLMGCSTFGQVAGLYSEGVKFFSVGCDGWKTGPSNKMTPPMAIAERGSLWVPVSGSWRDPVIYSERILEAALSQLYDKLGWTP